MMLPLCSRRRASLTAAALTTALAVAGGAPALPDDRRQPIHLEADSASFDQRSGVSEYRGNFELRQGSLRLAADSAKVFVRDGAFQRMEAAGAPTRFSYQPEAGKPPIRGSGQRVVYSLSDNSVTVSGDARVIQGGDEFRGATLVYDLDNAVIRASGGRQTGPDGSRGRIRITLQPDTQR